MHNVARDHGRTVLFVSHSMAAVSDLCSRAVVLESGTITYNGAVSGAISHYNGRLLSSEQFLDKSGPHIRGVSVSQSKLIAGTLSIDVEFDSPWPLDPFLIGVVIYSMQDNPIFGFYSWMDPEFKQTPVQTGVATLQIVDVPLQPGLYRVGVWLGEKKEKYDYLEEAAVFEFTGTLPSSYEFSAEVIGSVRVAGTWTIHACDRR